MLLPKISDTAATSQDGSSLEFIAAIAGRQCYIQDASDRGLCVVMIDDSVHKGYTKLNIVSILVNKSRVEAVKSQKIELSMLTPHINCIIMLFGDRNSLLTTKP